MTPFFYKKYTLTLTAVCIALTFHPQMTTGRYDKLWEFLLHEWDIVAGVLIVQEAGGLVGDLKGGNSHLETGNIVAATHKVLKDMVKRLHTVLR